MQSKNTKIYRNYVKVLFAAYPQMNDRINYNQKLINRIIHASFDSLMDAESVVSRVIDRIVRKERIIGLKNKIEQLINSLPVKNMQVMRMYFLEKLAAPQIAKNLDIGLRTVFRHISEGIELCSLRLNNFGLGINQLDKLRKEFKWLDTIYINQLLDDAV
ncbi:MAG: hypothetical protein FWE01_03020 [Firmicutes bacterium]|nr:hypothetical protein [Bacillota bacterium]